ncbi:hypothetical protein H6P81_009704 [Aristolochia fimbriata]|uniref:Uncharacterized protein n=1 Tax=Aristolochia fimbriata TaxID=158543 RepID=A0AAV7EMU2_ARIFI|nr:hypothetical protein H6P81_009704 [Aristolochia fimbriata]
MKSQVIQQGQKENYKVRAGPRGGVGGRGGRGATHPPPPLTCQLDEGRDRNTKVDDPSKSLYQLIQIEY